MTSLRNNLYIYLVCILWCVAHVVTQHNILTPFRRTQKFKHNRIINTDPLLYTHVPQNAKLLQQCCAPEEIQADLCYTCCRVPGDNFRIPKSLEFKTKHTHTHTHTHIYIYIHVYVTWYHSFSKGNSCQSSSLNFVRSGD